MFCPNCGNQISDGVKFCPKCGHNIGASGEGIPAVGPRSQFDPAPQPNPILGTLYDQKLAQAAREGLGMNWYKFIIYVQCFLGGLSGIATGITQILGLQYSDRARLVYNYYSGLKTVDVIYGITCIVIGILLIYTRFGLKKFKASSVGIYLFLPLVNAIAAILYLVVASIMLHTSLFDSNLVSGGTIGLIVGSIVLFIANYIYFNRRRHLFNEA